MHIFINSLPLIILFSIVYLYYRLTTVNLSTSAKFLQMRRYGIAAIVALLPLYITNTQLFFWIYPSHILVAAILILTERTIYFIATKDALTSFNMPFPIALGLYTFSGMVSLHILLLNIFPNHTFVNSFITFLQLILLLPQIINIFYYILFQSEINNNAIMLLYQTDKKEALEYLKSIDYRIWSAIIISFTILYTLLFYMNNYTLSHIPTLNIYTKMLFAFLTISTIFYSIKKLFMRCVLMESFKAVSHHYKHLQLFKTNHIQTLTNLQVIKNENTPQNIVLIIGESASRDYMSAFSYDLVDTTPWLKSNKSTSEFYFFNNAYSCASSTVPALSHALTTANYYNDISFNESVSIIDIAKKAGYKTYWFSNQSKIGVYDTPITMLAETADISRWVSDVFPKEKNFDELLVNFLPEIDLLNNNNFIIFHLMGSHIDYNNRYPQNFQKWSDANETGRVADFNNSLLYTDYVLEKIYNHFKTNNNLDALIYFSDHGTNPNRKRHPDGSGFSGLRILLVVYLSKKYQTQNPILATTLQNNKNKYFTNDLTFNLICGILNIKSNYYSEIESIASPLYSFNKNNLKTSEGKVSLMNDPFDSEQMS